VTTVVLFLVSFSFLAMVGRDRAYVADMAEQSLLAQENARQALQAREQMDSLLDAATETAVIGTDHRGIVRFFSAGAERMFGYTATRWWDSASSSTAKNSRLVKVCWRTWLSRACRWGSPRNPFGPSCEETATVAAVR